MYFACWVGFVWWGKGWGGNQVYRHVSVTTPLLIKPNISFLAFMYHCIPQLPDVCPVLACLFDLFSAPVMHRVWEFTWISAASPEGRACTNVKVYSLALLVVRYYSWYRPGAFSSRRVAPQASQPSALSSFEEIYCKGKDLPPQHLYTHILFFPFCHLP